MEVPAFAVDGSQVWYDTTLSPICDADGVVQHIIVTSVDITARKDAEKEARENRDYRVQASHLGTVMEMATGIAQPLTAIASYGHVAAQLINSSDSKGALNALASLDQQIHRAGETLRELRIFSQETLQSHTS
jgi:C4-dicarboxylate-specific signal transduction histidine kinase